MNMNRAYAYIFVMTIELAVIEGVLVYIGLELDKRMGWPGLGAAGGALLGILVWSIHLIQALKALEKRNEED